MDWTLPDHIDAQFGRDCPFNDFVHERRLDTFSLPQQYINLNGLVSQPMDA